MRTLVLVCLVALLGVGCAMGPKVHPRVQSFDLAQYEPYAKPGTAAITGQAFAKTRGGDVKVAAGNTIYLLPAVPYEVEDLGFMEALGEAEWIGFEPGKPLVSVSPAYDERGRTFRRTTVADAQGRFRFDGIPAGGWILACKITWEVPGEYGLRSTGGWARLPIEVQDSETKDVILTL